MTTPNRLLRALLAVVAGAVLLQAALAGVFIGGLDNTIPVAHTAIGSLLPWFAIAPAVVAFTARPRAPKGVRAGTVALVVTLWVQMVLGHLPAAESTAVHVPLGVALFGGSIALFAASRRPVPAYDAGGAR